RAQGYIALIREGRWQDAMRVIKMDNPFPGICGRICNHRCETACNRNQVDEPINIRALKRFVTDKVYADSRPPIEPAEIKFPHQRVAIIGAGPAGLTAAQDIIKTGFPVTIFEAMPVAGGMLRLGVPEYRLPDEIIEREVQDIVDLGVDLRLNSPVSNLDDIFAEGFAAVLIAVGAHEGIRLPIPGADLEGVLINTHFLRDVRLGKYSKNGDQGKGQQELGKNVLVLGGGNVAIDVARSAVRLGCRVSLACLESREQMPAHDWEINAAEEEGISLYPARSFEAILGDDQGRVSSVECMQVSSFNFDEGGRLNVEKIPGSNHSIPCDTVIFSVGQRAGLAFIPSDAGVGLTSTRTIAINPNTFAATRQGVFAAGDSVSGTAFVIEAVNSGHKAARSIIRYLQGEHLEPPTHPDLPVVHLSKDEIEERITRGEISHQPRVPMPQLPVEARIDNFVEVEGGYDDSSAQAEAARCLACGICSECMSCTFACGVNAINHDMVASQQTIQAGAVILAPGYQIYRAELSEEYGFGRYPNVINALQFERILSASGPTNGHIQRPSDGASPKRIAFLQCVGSRDQNHDYCSAVCCMYATKEAVMAIEHARAESRMGLGDGNVHCQVFLMDTRAYGKGYQDYYQRAEEKYGVQYTRCRISSLKEDPHTNNLIIRYSNSYEGDSKVQEASFDLVVLSVGMEISQTVRTLGNRLGIELDEYGFCHTTLFDPLQTSRPGIYVAGPFREPKDIPETVVEASGAAGAAARLLTESRHTLTKTLEYPPMKDVIGEKTRAGVFVCHCGSNIGGYLDVPDVVRYARTLKGVVYAEDNLYTCSQNTILEIIEKVKELELNRVVVASCTPLTHEPLFQDAIRQAGLNPHLFEMANIRNQCSWVHPNDWDAATAKAKTLVRMAVARAIQLEPLETSEFEVKKSAVVIGGGIAGMTAALTLADQGFPVHLIECTDKLGGNLRKLRSFVPHRNEKDVKFAGLTYPCNSPQEFLQNMIGQVTDHSLINIYIGTNHVETTGFKGGFLSTFHKGEDIFQVEHGATIIATGGIEYKGPEYGYGLHPRVLTQQEFEAFLDGEPISEKPSNNGVPGSNLKIDDIKSLVMIQCVGPAEKYCSRICCTTALKNALLVKELFPQIDVTILYKDIRVFGFKEWLYTATRRAGVRFIHYESDHKPDVTNTYQNEIAPRLGVRCMEPVLGKEIVLQPDLLVLSNPIVPPENINNLATGLKLPLSLEGFFLEAHIKLRPVDFATEGVFMAGLAHYPKLMDETIAQAQAAASRAAIILSQKSLLTNAQVATIDQSKCVGCLTCVRVCPFDVPKVIREPIGVGKISGAAYIEAAICHGCGTCASECPAKAIQLMHATDQQILSKLDALFAKELHIVQREF
ncbi:MAG: FAD-dependent oxidoreductase, partial [Anaerolineales bacterium]|nr:FAD-dependent oxidoreductase [Anaerolineales bacterium]